LAQFSVLRQRIPNQSHVSKILKSAIKYFILAFLTANNNFLQQVLHNTFFALAALYNILCCYFTPFLFYFLAKLTREQRVTTLKTEKEMLNTIKGLHTFACRMHEVNLTLKLFYIY